MRIRSKFKKGFTLVETILYIALFGIIFLTIIQFSFTIADYNRDTGTRIDIEKALVFIDEHMANTFRNAKSVNVTGSTFNSNNGILTLDMSANTSDYKISAQKLIYENNGSSFNLTSGVLNINQFYIEQVKSTKDSSVIGIRLTLKISSRINPNVSRTIQTSYTIK